MILGLLDVVRVTSVSFRLEWGQEMSATGGGTILVRDLRPPLWAMSAEGRQLTHAQARQASAHLNAMRGGIGTFFAFDPSGWFPQADYRGAALGEAEVEIHTVGDDSASLRLKGLPAGYVLTPGDYLSFGYGEGSTALHQVLESAVADGSGVTPSFAVAPDLRAGAEADLVVTLVRPGCEMRVVPGSVRTGTVSRLFSSISFEAVQVL